ncbi:MAG: methyltransferase domain-containing protein [Bacteriovoracia bacterium]
MTQFIDVAPSGRGPFAVKLAKIQFEDRVLNIGCFDGGLERHFLKNVSSCVGIDVNKDALEFAQKNKPNNAEFLYAKSENLPFEDNSFNKIFMLDVLEHVNDEKKSLKEVFRVLKPGGLFILSVPNDFLNFLDPDNLTRDVRNFVRKYIRKKELLSHPDHRHYGEKDLRSLLSDFEIIRVHKSGTPVFLSLAILYNALGIPQRWLTPFRKITDPIENAEYAMQLPTGFNIMVVARKPTA